MKKKKGRNTREAYREKENRHHKNEGGTSQRLQNDVRPPPYNCFLCSFCFIRSARNPRRSCARMPLRRVTLGANHHFAIILRGARQEGEIKEKKIQRDKDEGKEKERTMGKTEAREELQLLCNID